MKGKYTRIERLLLQLFQERAGECIPRKELMLCGWGRKHSGNPSTRVLDVYVGRLRKKLQEDQSPCKICAVCGEGYMLMSGPSAARTEVATHYAAGSAL